ncbi:twinkle homolog protein, chloroplastic/mitochondrial isoform X2 [Cryptomeria japonica]|uniref:twinkle homolog protein, chloroplastic/mitochondrial isoform X2 n=1 Tax=Cryptomeria japonica TaxID=3369 RepID=UPI0027DA3265|nr:twinkle homolog protein, chloroplastic/mitochondrial isoform X2 [Cryptomeria japonica]
MQRLNVSSRGPMIFQRAANQKMNATGISLRPFTSSDTLFTPGKGDSRNGDAQLDSLQKKLKRLNTIPQSHALRGQHQKCLCLQFGGENAGGRNHSLFILQYGNLAWGQCYRAYCSWSGMIQSACMPALLSSHLDTARCTSSCGVKARQHFTEANLHLQQVSVEICEYFMERGISLETLRRNGVMQRFHKPVIAFTYRKNGVMVNCKYRDLQKRFWQEKLGEKIPYGLDDIKGARDIIIVEGEIDKLSMEEAGYKNCISVPDGAPSKVSVKDLPPPEQDKKYEYLWKFREYFDQARHIILATDADEPGQALAAELARRLGQERCWRVTWPQITQDKLCKDANEVLMHLGPQALKEAIENAELYPIRGLFKFSNYYNEINSYYQNCMENELSVSTGWAKLDELYQVVPGELTIVTGVPNSGKSEWIDALLCNLNHHQGWKFALCSMENKVADHARKLLEKHIRKPFFNVKYGSSLPRINTDELEEGKQWLNKTFYLIRCEDDVIPSIKWAIDLAKTAVLRHGIHGLVLDPYNEFDHQRAPSQTETEYVSEVLTMVKRFAQSHNCHVWFVAHPRQLQNWKGDPPNIYEISGSSHFINKCDNAIVIHRNRDPDSGPLDEVKILVRKVRNKLAGKIGETYLSYNRITGEYEDNSEE